MERKPQNSDKPKWNVSPDAHVLALWGLKAVKGSEPESIRGHCWESPIFGCVGPAAACREPSGRALPAV